jgi:hypothetical protein
MTAECEWGIDGEVAHDERRPQFWTVAIYLCDRSYGGPEEGGWWFDTGVRMDGIAPIPRIFGTADAAYEYARDLQATLDDGLNATGNRDLSSVCCEGRYCAEVYEGYPPPHYPERRPHYE